LAATNSAIKVNDYLHNLHTGKYSSTRVAMCRNIKTLHNFKPPATDAEIQASALQFVRKLSGFTRPSKANQLAFESAVDAVARTARELLDALVTVAPPRNRDDEAVKARARAAERYRSVATTATATAGEPGATP
jgi:hypothetical protein